MLKDKTVLVTGGTGSFGKKFIDKILSEEDPKRVIVYSRDELKQFEMQEQFPSSNVIRYFIGDVRDLERLKMAMDGVDIVVHAAALKHVPVAEYNPFEAVKTNIIGGQNVIDASMQCGVKKVVALSTDKACSPINLYGATKLTSDKLFVAANNYKGKNDIKFSVVRYGNVMGSRGSVIPFFLKHKHKGFLPITDERMTRFNITLDSGVEFVMSSLERMWGGEIFVPKIPSYKITDIAEAIAPDTPIKVVGIRPGEKLHEEMISKDDAVNTIEYKDYFSILPVSEYLSWNVKDFLDSKDGGEQCSEGFEYNSFLNEHFLNVEELKELIENQT